MLHNYFIFLPFFFCLFCSAAATTPEDLCTPNPCLNSGTCFQLGTGGSYACVCTDLYTGTHCETFIARKNLFVLHVANLAVVFSVHVINFIGNCCLKC